MKTNKKISFKIFVPMFVLFTISIVLIILIIQLISKNRLNQNFDETLKGKTENLNQIMQKYIQNAKSTLDWFENSPRILKLFNDKNRNEALKLGQNAMKSFNLDYMVITDTEGNVFIRAHEPDAFGDNIGNQKNIQNAIKGIKSSGIEYGKKVGFSVRAGTPLKDSTGKIIACLSTGYVFSNARFVNLIKDELDADVAIFSGNEKQYSTINTNANAKINNEIILSQVLKGGKNSFIEEDYEGIHYKSGYVPIIDVQGNIAGMMSCSLNSEFISEMKNSLSLYTGSLITFIIFLVFLFLAFILNNSVIKPIQLLAKTNENIANGDLTVKINLNQEDEIGMLGKSMQNMAEKLKHIINDIIGNADNIAAASMQMSSASQELSQGASEQASAAEEVSASMEEMTANIQQTTHNSQQTEKISNKAAEGMRKVNTASKESLDSVKQIALKISIVNEIAFQTNILALNAAIEAARAGEHGKGFAVVAAEVRKLAERSKVAANEIDALSNSSVKVTDESNKFLTDLIPEIEKTSKLIQEITAASVEQSSGADQVNNAIQQLNQVTQQNAAASEEMATSSEELAAQAQQLKDVVSYFKVK